MPKTKKKVIKKVKIAKEVKKVAKVVCDHIWSSNIGGGAGERYICQKCGEKSS